MSLLSIYFILTVVHFCAGVFAFGYFPKELNLIDKHGKFDNADTTFALIMVFLLSFIWPITLILALLFLFGKGIKRIIGMIYTYRIKNDPDYLVVKDIKDYDYRVQQFVRDELGDLTPRKILIALREKYPENFL